MAFQPVSTGLQPSKMRKRLSEIRPSNASQVGVLFNEKAATSFVGNYQKGVKTYVFFNKRTTKI